jgi:hypothetical protein
MAKFINKKQQVMDFQLTPYGKYKLSLGRFRPSYYAFYDGEVLYDSKYAQSGSKPFTAVTEPQQNIHDRIKKDTSYLTSLVAFEELELSVPPSPLVEETIDDVMARIDARAENPLDPMDPDEADRIEVMLGGVRIHEGNQNLKYFSIDLGEAPRQDIPKPDIYRFGQPIGDSRFDGPTQQSVPAWKLALLQGTISSSSPINKLHHEERIPQLNTKVIYKKRIQEYLNLSDRFDPSTASEVLSTTPLFAGDTVISLIRDDLLAYMEEANTELLTENFDISVYKIEDVPPQNAIGEIFINSKSSNSSCVKSGSVISINDGVQSKTFKFTNTGDTAPVTGIQVIRLNRTAAGKCRTNAYNIVNAINDSGLNVEVIYDEHYRPNDYQYIKILNKNERTSHLYTNNAIAVTGSSDPSGPAGPFTDGGNLVKGFVSGAAKQELLHPKKFARVDPQIVDGFMMYPTKADTHMFGSDDPLTLTTSSVEYYFDILTDTQVDQKQACRGAQLFNKDSYYIDLEFECENEEVCADDERTFYDIYGEAISAADIEICED